MNQTFKILLLLHLAMLVQTAFSQEGYRMDFQLEGHPNERFRLVYYYGDQQIGLDTSLAGVTGKVSFRLDDSDAVGMYRLEKDAKQGLDFLFNRENVDISAGSDFALPSIKVNRSRENEIFFDYYRHKFDMEERLDILTGFLRYYPPSDTFYYTVAAHAEALSQQYGHYLDSLLGHYPDMLVTDIIRFDQLPDIRPGELDEQTRKLYMAHYFDSVDLRDSLILNTPILPVKIIDYLSLYVQPGAQREQQEKLFTQAVDSLMKFTEGGGKTREMVVNYLISGFQAYGFENVLTHLVENYVLGQSCVSDQQEEKLRLRIEGFKKLAVGTMAPDFEAADSKGAPVRLSSYKGKMVVLIFWAGDCPHCAAIMPEVGNLYARYKGKAEFIGISVDDDEATWRKALEEDKFQFPNVAELKGWEGQIANDYYIYATPTFFVIGRDGRIAAKPAGLAELQAALEK